MLKFYQGQKDNTEEKEGGRMKRIFLVLVLSLALWSPLAMSAADDGIYVPPASGIVAEANNQWLMRPVFKNGIMAATLDQFGKISQFVLGKLTNILDRDGRTVLEKITYAVGAIFQRIDVENGGLVTEYDGHNRVAKRVSLTPDGQNLMITLPTYDNLGLQVDSKDYQAAGNYEASPDKGGTGNYTGPRDNNGAIIINLASTDRNVGLVRGDLIRTTTFEQGRRKEVVGSAKFGGGTLLTFETKQGMDVSYTDVVAQRRYFYDATDDIGYAISTKDPRNPGLVMKAKYADDGLLKVAQWDLNPDGTVDLNIFDNRGRTPETYRGDTGFNKISTRPIRVNNYAGNTSHINSSDRWELAINPNDPNQTQWYHATNQINNDVSMNVGEKIIEQNPYLVGSDPVFTGTIEYKNGNYYLVDSNGKGYRLLQSNAGYHPGESGEAATFDGAASQFSVWLAPTQDQGGWGINGGGQEIDYAKYGISVQDYYSWIAANVGKTVSIHANLSPTSPLGDNILFVLGEAR